jgi:hypothetical protein
VLWDTEVIPSKSIPTPLQNSASKLWTVYGNNSSTKTESAWTRGFYQKSLGKGGILNLLKEV